MPGKEGPNGNLTVCDTPNLTVAEILYLLRIIPSADDDPLAKMKAAHDRLKAEQKMVMGVPRSAAADERLRETMAAIDEITGGGIRG